MGPVERFISSDKSAIFRVCAFLYCLRGEIEHWPVCCLPVIIPALSAGLLRQCQWRSIEKISRRVVLWHLIFSMGPALLSRRKCWNVAWVLVVLRNKCPGRENDGAVFVTWNSFMIHYHPVWSQYSTIDVTLTFLIGEHRFVIVVKKKEEVSFLHTLDISYLLAYISSPEHKVLLVGSISC